MYKCVEEAHILPAKSMFWGMPRKRIGRFFGCSWWSTFILRARGGLMNISSCCSGTVMSLSYSLVVLLKSRGCYHSTKAWVQFPSGSFQLVPIFEPLIICMPAMSGIWRSRGRQKKSRSLQYWTLFRLCVHFVTKMLCLLKKQSSNNFETPPSRTGQAILCKRTFSHFWDR